MVFLYNIVNCLNSYQSDKDIREPNQILSGDCFMLFGLFTFARKVRKLRKKWDRLREKALKKKQPLKEDILPKMDLIENNLRILEERKVSRVERSRLAKEIEIDLEGIKAMVKMKEEEYSHQEPAPSQQRYQTRPK